METYTPVPALVAGRRPPRALRTVGTVLLIAALVAALVPVVRYTFQLDRPPDFKNYGLVHTRLGVAAVVCGGEVTKGCREQSALVFASCDTVRANFPDGYDTTVADPAVRDLIGKRPPSGSEWVVTCRDGGLPSDHLADLKPN